MIDIRIRIQIFVKLRIEKKSILQYKFDDFMEKKLQKYVFIKKKKIILSFFNKGQRNRRIMI